MDNQKNRLIWDGSFAYPQDMFRLINKPTTFIYALLSGGLTCLIAQEYMFHCVNVNICNFAIFETIFIEFSPNCTEFGMLLCTIFFHFSIGKGHLFGPKIGIGKSLNQM